MCEQCENRPTTANVKEENLLISPNETYKWWWKAVSMDTSLRVWWFDHQPTEQEKALLPPCVIFSCY